MKISSVTYHNSDNYGSVLQAYALNQFLINEGYDAQIVDYEKKEVKKLYNIYKKPNNRYAFLMNIYNTFYLGKLQKRKQRYIDFRRDYLSLTKKFTSKESIAENEINSDVYICGSDQVWNTEILDFDETYMLDFVKNKKKIAYSVSAGPKKAQTERLLKYKSLLDDFSYITAREENTGALVSDIICKEVPITLDPVFLLSKKQWDLLSDNAAKIKEKDYIFCYFPGLSDSLAESISKKLCDKLKTKRILVVSEWRNISRSGVKLYDAGPLEFVALIKNAAFVLTNSFHGTAFSIIYNKPFLVCTKENAADSRIKTILTKTGLLSREITSECNEALFYDKIDYNKANRIISERSIECAELLKQMINS